MQRGTKHTPETIRKISAAHRGKKISPSQRKKISASVRQFWADVHALTGMKAGRRRERASATGVGQTPVDGNHHLQEVELPDAPATR